MKINKMKKIIIGGILSSFVVTNLSLGIFASGPNLSGDNEREGKLNELIAAKQVIEYNLGLCQLEKDFYEGTIAHLKNVEEKCAERLHLFDDILEESEGNEFRNENYSVEDCVNLIDAFLKDIRDGYEIYGKGEGRNQKLLSIKEEYKNEKLTEKYIKIYRVLNRLIGYYTTQILEKEDGIDIGENIIKRDMKIINEMYNANLNRLGELDKQIKDREKESNEEEENISDEIWDGPEVNQMTENGGRAGQDDGILNMLKAERLRVNNALDFWQSQKDICKKIMANINIAERKNVRKDDHLEEMLEENEENEFYNKDYNVEDCIQNLYIFFKEIRDNYEKDRGDQQWLNVIDKHWKKLNENMNAMEKYNKIFRVYTKLVRNRLNEIDNKNIEIKNDLKLATSNAEGVDTMYTQYLAQLEEINEQIDKINEQIDEEKKAELEEKINQYAQSEEFEKRAREEDNSQMKHDNVLFQFKNSDITEEDNSQMKRDNVLFQFK